MVVCWAPYIRNSSWLKEDHRRWLSWEDWCSPIPTITPYVYKTIKNNIYRPTIFYDSMHAYVSLLYTKCCLCFLVQAVPADLTPTGVTGIDTISFISYGGCAISLFFLFLTLLTYLIFRWVKSPRIYTWILSVVIAWEDPVWNLYHFVNDAISH